MLLALERMEERAPIYIGTWSTSSTPTQKQCDLAVSDAILCVGHICGGRYAMGGSHAGTVAFMRTFK